VLIPVLAGAPNDLCNQKVSGRFAASRGEPMENNPHHYTNPDHLFREWQEGWQAGQQKTVDGGQDPGGDIELLGR